MGSCDPIVKLRRHDTEQEMRTVFLIASLVCVMNAFKLERHSEEAASRSRRSPLVLTGDPRNLVVHLAGEIIGEVVGENVDETVEDALGTILGVEEEEEGDDPLIIEGIGKGIGRALGK